MLFYLYTSIIHSETYTTILANHILSWFPFNLNQPVCSLSGGVGGGVHVLWWKLQDGRPVLYKTEELWLQVLVGGEIQRCVILSECVSEFILHCSCSKTFITLSSGYPPPPSLSLWCKAGLFLLQFLQQYLHYQATLEVFRLKPKVYNETLAKLANFLAQVSHQQHCIIKSDTFDINITGSVTSQNLNKNNRCRTAHQYSSIQGSHIPGYMTNDALKHDIYCNYIIFYIIRLLFNCRFVQIIGNSV